MANKVLIYAVVLTGALIVSIALEWIKKLSRYDKLEKLIIKKLSK